MKELKKQTLDLKRLIKELKEKYETNEPPKTNDKVFFLKMKEETESIYSKIEEWEESSLAFVKRREVNVHPHQVVSTRENFELLLLHSFYIDARRKRYMELNHSCDYIFDRLLDEINKHMKAGLYNE